MLTRKVFGITLAFWLFTIVLSSVALVANADQGVGLVCDTAEQVEQTTRLIEKTGKVAVALETVNSKEPVCSVIGVQYVRGKEVKQISHHGSLYSIVAIALTGIIDGNVLRLVIPPIQQFTIFKVNGTQI